ncbi:winged helix-turn-helix domain-containing protein [Methanolobus sp.]|uniref:helix-turn-helix transcriptional regulator n=1 Tax=Methanolobus sp. TaxID=1874737 RepID=UPI00272F3285|nr:winged helix-turn-helix domain-containing protein [Methanolobus sp.]
MKKPLLDVIFMSEKRKGVLLLLKDGAKKMEYLLNSLDTTRQALLPQIKTLEEHYLVNKYDDTYELTTIGELVTDDMFPLLNTLEVLDSDVDYWGTHNLNFIPPHLLKRMNELGGCEIIKPLVSEMYDLNAKITNSSYISNSVNMIAASFHPSYPTVFSEMARKNVNVNAIFSKDVIDTLQENHYTFLEEMTKGKSFNIFVHHKKLDFLAFLVNDYYTLMRLLTNEGEIDGQYIMCSNLAALKWGKYLFDFYLKDSIPITEL